MRVTNCDGKLTANRRRPRLLAAVFFTVAFLGAAAFWIVTTAPVRSAEAAYDRGELAEAFRISRKHLESHSSSDRAARIVALCLSRMQQPLAAERYFVTSESALRLDDWRVRASGLMDAGEVERAADVTQRILQKWPADVTALRNLAVIRFQQGRTLEAIELGNRLITIQPHAAVAYAMLGTFYRNVNKPADTVRCHLEALRLDPELKTVPEANHFLNDLAVSLMETGRASEAERYVLQSLAILREAETLDIQGQLRREAGDALGAEAVWLEAIELNPRFVPAMTNLGTLRLGRGQTTEALELFRQAVSCDSTSSEAHYGLGLALERAGMREQAKKHLAEAERLRSLFVRERVAAEIGSQ
jgi:tetratricopeptide (TPR) repeat protein